MTSRILIVTTSHSVLGDSGRTTGLWAEELMVPYSTFRAAGLGIDVASIAGGRAPVDPASLGEPGSADGLEDLVSDTLPITKADPGRYDAVFLVGGHGTMWDFPTDPNLAEIVARVGVTGVVGAVCHGAAGLLGAVGLAGTPWLEGRRLTGFSDHEEAMVGLSEAVPFLLQQRLAGQGADVVLGAPFESHAVSDGRLVTGQNPASSEAVARLLVDTLRKSAA